MRILLVEGIHPIATQILRDEGFEVQSLAVAPPPDELKRLLEGVSALGIRSKTHLTKDILDTAGDLLTIGAFCIGTNQIEMDAASDRGMCVFNAPFSNTRSVAELVIAEIVMLSRQIGDRVREMHGGRWRKAATGSHEVRGKTLGIVGYGHIGRQVGVLAEGFGMRVVFYDIAQQLPMGNNFSSPNLDRLLAESDFVTLHVPATPQTHEMIGEREIATMKQGACLLNLSRGTVVVIPALARALANGHLAGAAIDVYPDEPSAAATDDFETELRELPNVILTPHIGGSTLEAQENIGREVSASLSKFLRMGAASGSVNFPSVELAPSPNAQRITNVHRNVPGVLRDLNRIVSEAEANVQAQVLATRGDIGYLVMDVEGNVSATVCERMNQLGNTIRARALHSPPR
jgi:D-3-phosphoglycerate dehydrogenase / 2-oxoglutarate reductase